MSENEIESIPKEIGNLLNLERLDLALNSIDEISKEFGTLNFLTSFNKKRKPKIRKFDWVNFA